MTGMILLRARNNLNSNISLLCPKGAEIALAGLTEKKFAMTFRAATQVMIEPNDNFLSN